MKEKPKKTEKKIERETGKQNEKQYATYVFTINIDNCCIFFGYCNCTT